MANVSNVGYNKSFKAIMWDDKYYHPFHYFNSESFRISIKWSFTLDSPDSFFHESDSILGSGYMSLCCTCDQVYMQLMSYPFDYRIKFFITEDGYNLVSSHMIVLNNLLYPILDAFAMAS